MYRGSFLVYALYWFELQCVHLWSSSMINCCTTPNVELPGLLIYTEISIREDSSIFEKIYCWKTVRTCKPPPTYRIPGGCKIRFGEGSGGAYKWGGGYKSPSKFAMTSLWQGGGAISPGLVGGPGGGGCKWGGVYQTPGHHRHLVGHQRGEGI